MNRSHRPKIFAIWQFFFILTGTTWLWAPLLNRTLSSRISLISQYETSIQPYSWLFRTGDVAGALLLIAAAVYYLKTVGNKTVGWLLFVIGVGMLIDPLWTTSCRMVADSCREYFSLSYFVHATESVITSAAIILLGVYDIRARKRLVSVFFVGFQIAYGLLFLSQLASQDHFNTASQFVYQAGLVIWLAWFCRDFIGTPGSIASGKGANWVKYGFAVWAFANGILAVLISLAHLKLFGKVEGLYFADDTAWLAQYGAIIGVALLYISRHLARGERRARQIFLAVTAVEVIKYSVISPNAWLLLVYLLTFTLLFVFRDNFDRGVIDLSLKVRLKDVGFLLSGLLLTLSVAAAVLYKNNELSDITRESIDHFFDFTLRSEVVSRAHLRSALLAHTLFAFLAFGLGALLWALFRPSKRFLRSDQDTVAAKDILRRFASSPEDYFKLWPRDKRFFWASQRKGFIAYKLKGAAILALADPVGSRKTQKVLLQDFLAQTRARRLRACFLPILKEESLPLYKTAGLESLQIGATALINIDHFLDKTVHDKWWRWQKNRARKNNYQYLQSNPPHSAELISKLKNVSDLWLDTDGHRERGFALGYFDAEYLQDCPVHYLRDQEGEVVAFTNQLPALKKLQTASVDLLRYRPGARSAMPFLLANCISSIKTQNRYIYFDLGFVPFAATKDPVLRIAGILSAGRFSAKGLEQFKNKFNPEWRPTYMAYDGDFADLALIAVNLEGIMRVSP
jgi:lysylphosphatidylglycerol synthetase-like protein (DUF2156 family)